MKSRKRIALLFVFIIAAALVVTSIFRPKTPPSALASYHGKTAQAWLREWPTNATAVNDAIHSLGTNALPGIIEVLGARDSVWTRCYRKIYPKLPASWRRDHALPKSAAELAYPAELLLPVQTELRPFLSELVHAAERNPPTRFAILSATYSIFGPNDNKCVSSLAEFLDDTNRIVRLQATWSLQNIGPPAAAAIPSLKTAMTDSNIDVRICAAWAIWRIGRETNLVSAALHKELSTSESSSYQWLIPGYLSEINPTDPVNLPLLIGQLNSLDEGKRTGAAISLCAFGAKASAAVPGLTNAIESGSPKLRYFALRALRNIDPATAAKYGEAPVPFAPPPPLPARIPRPAVIPPNPTSRF